VSALLAETQTSLESIIMIDNFVKEKDFLSEASATMTKEELDQEETRIDGAWTQQTKKVKEELDEILDESISSRCGS
jgi:hypothetical protein